MTRSIQWPWLWVVIVGVHAAAAAYAWHMLPHGFPAGHPRFWINQVLPWVLIAIGVACIVALWRGGTRIAALAILIFPGLYVGLTAGWIAVFPITGARPAQFAAVIAGVLFVCAFASLRGVREARATMAMSIGAAFGLCVGGAVPWSQRGPDAQTHPSVPAAPEQGGPPPSWVRVAPEVALLSVDAGSVHIQLRPLLAFISRSPDRGWTLLASPQDRVGPERSDTGEADDPDTYRYDGEEPATLRLSSSSEDTLRVDATTVLPAAVYSHLNSYCVIDVHGHHRLFLSFSPMPTERIEVRFSEYPTGRPSRFAYLDGESVLHVVEATSGEKGPFIELARGPLPANAALGITLFDEQQPIARIELADFAAQASTQISPTGGWGVPENAIEFSLRGDRPDADAVIYITLAGTSVGRGFDSVGHAGGTYRNRIEVRR